MNSLLNFTLKFLCYFIVETHDGVQDMACDTFIKIAQRCRRHFVQVVINDKKHISTSMKIQKHHSSLL